MGYFRTLNLLVDAVIVVQLGRGHTLVHTPVAAHALSGHLNEGGPSVAGMFRAVRARAGQGLTIESKVAFATPVPGVLQVRGNSEADLNVLLSAVVTNLTAILAVLLVFSMLRLRYPLVYMGREEETSPAQARSFWSWVSDTWALSTTDVEKASTLDHAMLIYFCKLCTRIAVLVGLPMVCVLCPLHAFFGGMAAGGDRLSYLGFANVQQGNWLCYIHAFVVWAVVYATMTIIYTAQEQVFLPRRFEWLRSMPPARARTVLVEAIPPRYCSDSALKAYFTGIFSEEQVESAYVVKHTQKLVKLLRDVDHLEATLKYEVHQWEERGAKVEERPHFLALRPLCNVPHRAESHQVGEDSRTMHGSEGHGQTRTAYQSLADRLYDLCQICVGGVSSIASGVRVDTINYYEDTIKEMKGQVAAERQRILESASSSDGGVGVYGSSGFVTFATRRDAVLALQVQYMKDEKDLVASIPPEPSDVIFSDLLVSPAEQRAYTLLGWALVVAVFLSFLPMVISISTVTSLHALENNVGFLATLTTDYPTLAVILDGVLGSLALTLFMDFLPTILNMIFYGCFQLKSANWAQLHLQTAYFWFLLIFVVLITALGGSLINTLRAIVDSPSKISALLAEALPVSTHFYMKYLAMQWVTAATGTLRIVQLMKFVLFRAVWGDEQAKQLSEPEDQDYYGIGARSARFAIDMVIVLVFSSLSPIIMLIGFVDFAIRTLLFEYLFVFAETRKNDLGGVFWVRQIDHLHYGLFVYILLQVGCLAERGPGPLPWVLTMPAFLIWLILFLRFKRLRWESLPFEEVAGIKELYTDKEMADTSYQQPELRDSSSEETMQKVRGRWGILRRMRDPIVKPLLDAFGLRGKKKRFRLWGDKDA